jgi:hypothetical protein
MEENILDYQITINEESKPNLVIKNHLLYPSLNDNYRNIIKQDVLTKERFWFIQNTLRLNPFIYKKILETK